MNRAPIGWNRGMGAVRPDRSVAGVRRFRPNPAPGMMPPPPGALGPVPPAAAAPMSAPPPISLASYGIPVMGG